MGFLKFLKKDKKELGLDEGLDAPPLPPNLSENEFDRISLDSAATMPDFKSKEPYQQRFPAETKTEEYLPSFKENLQSDAELEAGLEEAPEPVLEAKRESFEDNAYKSSQANANRSYNRFEREAVREEKNLLKHKLTKRIIYIRIEKLKEILGDISAIKGNLKTANEMMAKMDAVNLDTNREFERYKGNLIDLQKKFIFVDKSLFKGERK